MGRDLAARGERALVGFDFSFSLPFADAGAFFPGEDSPADARALWAEVDARRRRRSAHAAHAYIAHRRRHFWTGAADGPKAARARLRTVEHAGRRSGAVPRRRCSRSSARRSAARRAWRGCGCSRGRRCRCGRSTPIPAAGPLLVEIYCRTFAADAGVRGKIRDRSVLDTALARLGSAPAAVPATFSDHVGDALISAAGMRRAAADPAMWHPAGLAAVRATEGWTFGVA